MRIAVLSDIHSNLQALTRAFSFIEENAVDEIYCLGDIVGYGGNPNECVDLIRSRARHVVLGNHDHAAVEISEADYFTKPGKIAAEWTNKTLTKENRDYLASLPLVVKTDLCTLAHASPHQPENWTYVLSLPVAERQFKHFDTRLCFIGHSHVPVVCGEDLKTFAFRKGVRYLINVGSTGQPRDGNPRLSFGLFDTSVWSYHNIRLEYDAKGAAEQIDRVGLPSVLGKRLLQGI
jgi:predicted phosphodiesterase